jgi:chaperone modulatory protein CbpM
MSNTDDTLHYLDTSVYFAADEVLRITGMSGAEFTLLTELGVVTAQGGRYAAHVISTGRRAVRLRDAFELEGSGLALALSLLARIDDLENRLQALSCELPR